MAEPRRAPQGIKGEMDRAQSVGEVLGILAGYVSVCWSQTPRGIFRSEAAEAATRYATERVEAMLDQFLDQPLEGLARPFMDAIREAERSIYKHGDQAHLPDGTGPETYPLEVRPSIGELRPHVTAESLAVRATLDTKAHSQNEGGDGTVTWWHILREEVLEASAEEDPVALRAELVQVAAVALKWAEAIDRRQAARLE